MYNSKSEVAQLSRNWLSKNHDRYINIIKKESPEAYTEMLKILDEGKSFKTALVYAANNPKIQFSEGIDEYLGYIVGDPKIKSFDLIKILPGD
ncbi:MAG: hypothetical protein ACOX2G_11735 [Bacillota bacterium]